LANAATGCINAGEIVQLSAVRSIIMIAFVLVHCLYLHQALLPGDCCRWIAMNLPSSNVYLLPMAIHLYV
jgi:hypothetical protein